MNRTLRCSLAATLLSVAALASGCGPAAPPTSFPSIPLRADQRALGTLIDERPAEGLAKGLSSATSRATRITYTTIGPTGEPAAATAGVYLPAGSPPAGGWPVVAFGHGSTGVQPQCAPTLDPQLYQNLPIVVAALTRLRAAVVMPDYLGLGSAGRHPYLDSTSHGHDVLGAIRAGRATGAPLSSRTFLLGASQGGRATQAAAELAPTATPDIRILANAMAAPALSLQLVARIAAGTLTGPQYSAIPQIVFGAQASDPRLTMRDVVRGTLLTSADGLLQGCTGGAPRKIDTSGPPIGPADVRPDGTPAGAAGSAAFAEYLRRTELPRRPNPAVATLVVNGSEDQLIAPEWTRSAVARMCAAGVPVEHRERSGDHFAPDDLDAVIGWLADRIEGKPAKRCARPEDARQVR